jgi:hypothetical protein
MRPPSALGSTDHREGSNSRAALAAERQNRYLLGLIMKDYRQGAFRNPFEEHLFETIQDAVAWCARYAAKEGFPRSVKGEVYHNVRTAEFHGELSTTDTFADPQSREIDVLVELELPRQIRLLTSGKDSDHRQKLEHVGDYEGLLASSRSNDHGWLYWAMIVARKGFQSGCEETAKRADIALVPPITGSVEWLSVQTQEEVLDRVTDAVKIFTLGNAWRRDRNSYQTGDVYNSIYVGTREPSGLPGTTRIRQGDGSEKPMKEFMEEALAKPENRFRIPLSRDRTYVPFFAPPSVQSNTKDGKLASSEVGSTIIGPSRGMRFFRVRTETGRELIADGQRALYTVRPGRSSRRLVRVDCLRVGTQILCSDDEGTQTRLEAVSLVEEIK